MDWEPLLLAGLSLATPATGAVERKPEVLPLTSKWIARFDTDACHLLGQFGTGDRAVVAMFTRYQPGDNFDLSLAGNRLRGGGATADAKVDFGLRADSERRVMHGKIGPTPAFFFKSIRLDGWERSKPEQEAPDLRPEQEAAVKSLTVSIRGKPPLRLATGEMGRPMAVMRACLSDLLASWGYDPTVQATLSRRVTPLSPPPTWLTYLDYPLTAMMMGHNGFVQFRLDVDAKGEIAGCHVLARTNPDDFADTTCRTLKKRGRFKPALDAAGNPIRSYFISSVRFVTGGR